MILHGSRTYKAYVLVDNENRFYTEKENEECKFYTPYSRAHKFDTYEEAKCFQDIHKINCTVHEFIENISIRPVKEKEEFTNNE